MRRWALAVAPLVLVALLLPSIAAHAADAPGAATVSMKAFAFAPVTVTIRQGGTVTWTYDETPTDIGCESPVFQTPLPVNCPGHSTTAVDTSGGKPLWDSGVHRADGFPFTTTFAKAGTFHYICVVHGGAGANNPVTHMEGDVIVLAAAAAPAPVVSAAAQTAQPATLALTGSGTAWGRFGQIALFAGLVLLAARRRLDTLAA